MAVPSSLTTSWTLGTRKVWSLIVATAAASPRQVRWGRAWPSAQRYPNQHCAGSLLACRSARSIADWEQTELGGVSAHGVAVGCEHERYVVGPRPEDLLHATVSGVDAHLADVDRDDPSRVSPHDVGIDLRVPFP